MEFGLREWLIIIGIIVIAGILFDGWRRMRGGKGRLKFKLDRSLADLPDDGRDPDLLSEPRLVSSREVEPPLDEESFSAYPPSVEKGRGKRHSEQPHQGDLNLGLDLGEPVPTLLEPVDEGKPARRRKAEKNTQPEPTVEEPRDTRPVEEVLIINVMARDPEGFKGPALLQNILESGLRFGEKDIFHRHESMAGNGEVLFSMANALKPGTFDLDDIEGFSTRAVSFFLLLPGPRHPKQGFDVMIAAARKLANELNGELKDDQRSVLTAQTIQHYRQRIADFERRQLTVKR